MVIGKHSGFATDNIADTNNVIFATIIVLGEGLTANFAEATVEMADCPNFNEWPYNFYREGTYRRRKKKQCKAHSIFL